MKRACVTALVAVSQLLIAATSAFASEPNTHDLRVDELRKKVTDLRERVDVSRQHLERLRNRYLGIPARGPARLVLVGSNSLGALFELEGIKYVLDGSALGTDGRQFGVLCDVELLPGRHRLDVFADLHGDGLGVFPYAEGYRFGIHSTFAFELAPGRAAYLEIDLHQKGSPLLTAYEDRPDLRFTFHP